VTAPSSADGVTDSLTVPSAVDLAAGSCHLIAPADANRRNLAIPAAFSRFLREACQLSPDSMLTIAPDAMPERDRRLLVHTRDMTSTLATFYRGDLRVEVLQASQSRGLYLREVFLRTLAEDRIVEYGVMAVALDQFTTAQQTIIQTGRTPLGALLHQAEIPFKSSPLQYFTSPAAKLAGTPLAPYATSACYGRINQLSRSTGEPLAWIVEILPCP